MRRWSRTGFIQGASAARQEPKKRRNKIHSGVVPAGIRFEPERSPPQLVIIQPAAAYDDDACQRVNRPSLPGLIQCHSADRIRIRRNKCVVQATRRLSLWCRQGESIQIQSLDRDERGASPDEDHTKRCKSAKYASGQGTVPSTLHSQRMGAVMVDYVLGCSFFY